MHCCQRQGIESEHTNGGDSWFLSYKKTSRESEHGYLRGINRIWWTKRLFENKGWIRYEKGE